jgi:signal transduction histidine kinase
LPRLGDVDVQGIKSRLPGPDRLVWLAGMGVVVSAYFLYGSLLFWTAPTIQGPKYDGPHRLPSMVPPELAALVSVLALPLLFARNRPAWAFAAILAETVPAAEFGARTWGMYAAAILLVCYLALVRSAAVSACAGAVLVLVWFIEQSGALSTDTPPDLGIGTGQMALYSACGWGVGYGLRKRREYGASLRDQSAARAVMAERLRIARELHDMVAHSIGIIAVLAGAAGRVMETQPKAAREALESIEATSRETLTGLQRMVTGLRHAEPEAGAAPLVPAQGLADLDHLVARAAEAGLRVAVVWRGERRALPPEIDLSAFRVIQEAVTNVVRHAGTHACRVSIAYEERDVSIEILDNGRGDPHPHSGGGGFGLLGMRERVAILDGEFSAGPRADGGFRVAARLPA